MDPNSVTQITTYLDKIGEKLGVGAKMIWPWLVRQTYVESFLAWLFFLITATITYKAYRYMFAHWDVNKSSRYDKTVPNAKYSIYDNDHEPVWIILAVVLGVLFLIFTFVLVCDGFKFLNPEYYALRKLMEMLPGTK